MSSRALRRALDEQLFAPGPWLAIDAANVEVKGTRTATLDQALALVGHGRVASIVGRLRPEVVGVDVDSSVFADDIVDTLTAFCRANGLWHLVRPSGGAPGRAHLFLIPGRHRAALDELVLRLRAELGIKANPATGRRAKPLGRAHVDVRSQLRPLSAPHRCQTTPTLDRDVLATALADLEEVLAHLPADDRDSDRDPGRGTRRDHRGPRLDTRASDGLLEARTPLLRPRRDLPAGWAAYLRQGRKAAAAAGLDREPGSRSTIEYDATRAMVLAGLDEPAAWDAISTAHRSAFPKARANGRRWWWHVWNAAVDKADEWLAARRAELTQHPALVIGNAGDVNVDEAVAEAGSTAADVAWALSRAYAELDATWRSWPAQTRHTRRELMRCVLERMTRRGCTSVALPQRDALQDCAVESRNTIAAARDDLVAAGLLEVTSTHVRGTTDTADTWSLPTRFLTGQVTATVPSVTNELDERGRGVGHFEPSRDTPPRAALPLRRTLGLPRAHLLEVLLTDTTPRLLAELASDAGLLASSPVVPGMPPSAASSSVQASGVVLLSKDQCRTVRAHLHTLAGLGLALVDANGAWTATSAARASTTSSSAVLVDHPEVLDDVVRLHRRGQDRQAAVTAAVTAERTEFRARLEPAARRHRWLAQRQDALARQAKLDVARRKAWWDSLNPVTRHQRRTTAAEQFAALAPYVQAQRKHDLAIARARAGLSERQRYEEWWTSLSPAERDQRSIVRAWVFHAQPEPLRAGQVAAWTAHRTRWDLPHRARRANRDPAAVPRWAGRSEPPPPVVDLTVSARVGELQLVSVP